MISFEKLNLKTYNFVDTYLTLNKIIQLYYLKISFNYMK
jgi:hypothetical protein